MGGRVGAVGVTPCSDAGGYWLFVSRHGTGTCKEGPSSSLPRAIPNGYLGAVHGGRTTVLQHVPIAATDSSRLPSVHLLLGVFDKTVVVQLPQLSLSLFFLLNIKERERTVLR